MWHTQLVDCIRLQLQVGGRLQLYLCTFTFGENCLDYVDLLIVVRAYSPKNAPFIKKHFSLETIANKRISLKRGELEMCFCLST